MNARASAPRKPIAKRDQEIGRRIRRARSIVRLTQSEFATQLGIGRERFASYEDGRAPLRWDLGLRICRQFIIGEKWLATGRGEMRRYLNLRVRTYDPKLGPDATYSSFFDTILADGYERRAKANPGKILLSVEPGDDPAFVNNIFDLLLDSWKKGVPKEFLPALLLHLMVRGRETLEHYQATGKPLVAECGFIGDSEEPIILELPMAVIEAP